MGSKTLGGQGGLIGRSLSHHKILKKLGEGGMGAVYLAEDSKLDRRVALKVMPEDMASDPDRLARFEREARAVAALNHPNIITVHSIEEDAGIRFITMELVEGKPLEKLIPSAGLDLETFFDVAIPLADALSVAHGKGITHRDLKPANIMVTDEDHLLKILDFGLAKFQAPAADTDQEMATLTAPAGMTQVGAVMGTMPYMSPEQVEGKPVDHRTDLFSLGIILYEMLTGQRPFQGASAAGLTSAILRDAPAPLTESRTELPRHLQRIVGQCLEKDPGRRFQTALDVRNQLHALRRELGVGGDTRAVSAVLPTEPAAPSHRRWWSPRWLRLGGAAAVALALVALGIKMWPRAGESPAGAPAPRPSVASVAVIGFKNLGPPGTEWLSTAFSEMFSTELSSGGAFRVIPGESVSRMKLELSLPDAAAYAEDTLKRIRANLGTDYVVLGSFLVLSGEQGQLQVQLRLQDARSGETIVAVSETGIEAELFKLVSSGAGKLRETLGVGALSASETAAAGATISSDPEATRLYAQGLAKLRGFDSVTARDLFEQAVAVDPEFALAQSALSQAWADLGYDSRAAAAATRAYELAEGLPRREFLFIEGRYFEMTDRPDEAIESFAALWRFHPENLDYGLRLAELELAAGRPNEALSTVAALRNLPPPAGADPRIDLVESDIELKLSDYSRVLELLDTAYDKAGAAEASLIAAQARRRLGWVLNLVGKPGEAGAALAEAQSVFEKAGNRRGQAEVLNRQAVLLKYDGRLGEAEERYREAVRISREIGHRQRLSSTLSNLAVLTYEKGRISEAISMLDECLEIAREIDSRGREAKMLSNLAHATYHLGDLSRAVDLAQQSLAMETELGSRIGIAWNTFYLGQFALAAADLGEAEVQLERAKEISVELDYQHLLGYVLVEAAELKLERGLLDLALQDLDSALEIRLQLGERSTQAETRLARARVLAAKGDLAEAEGLARAAAAEFAREGRSDQQLRSLSMLAEILLDQGKADEAERLLGPSVFSVDSTESLEIEVVAAIAVYRVRGELGDREDARQKLRAAADRAGEAGLLRIAARAEAELEG